MRPSRPAYRAASSRVAGDFSGATFVNPDRRRIRQPDSLRQLGFTVTETNELPPTPDLLPHHVIVVAVTASDTLPMLGTHLRAKPHFGRRALIALVPADTGEQTRRDAVASGFDAAMPMSADGRVVAAALLRALRPRPEHRCVLRPTTGNAA